MPIMLVVLVNGCASPRDDRDANASYVDGTREMLRTHCASCHAGSAPAAGWRADSYVAVIGCANGDRPVTEGGDRAPILTVLDRPDHAAILSATQRARLRAWVLSGAPATRGGVHPARFADPRAPEGHARFLRARQYRPLRAADDPDACAKCHEGAGPRPPGVTFAASNATPCTTCHTAARGAMACGTCHEPTATKGERRDACFVAAPSAAHAAHVGASASRSEGFACETCHPVPAAGDPQVVLSGTHANAAVEVWFDWARVGARASFDPQTKRCAGTCHDHGGAHPQPSWSETRASCNDCHGAPPKDHYAGSCTTCHHEANAGGTALSNPIAHVNARVDLGDGSGKCGACHGSGDSPWPTTGAHAQHAAPASARPVPCETCHVVPAPGARHPVGRGHVDVVLSGMALTGSTRARYDATTRSCADTYCHAGRGGTRLTPRWDDGEAARACGACHAVPPPPPHPVQTSCGGGTCHEGLTIAGPAIAPGAAATHVDGRITR